MTKGGHVEPVSFALDLSEDRNGLVILREGVEQPNAVSSDGIYLKRQGGQAECGSAALRLMQAQVHAQSMGLETTESAAELEYSKSFERAPIAGSIWAAGLSEMLSAIRMSDGTLKFLALLAALFHRSPPPLTCIEEPEIGLHPDALQLVAEALVEASQSMQLIVTTHSDALIDALSDRPETVLVCERDFDNGTQMTRLSKADLKEWLEHYKLGQLWRKGEISGGRW